MKEPKVFCECNSEWMTGIGGINPHQLTHSDLYDKSLYRTCPVCQLYPWHDAYYENEQFDKEKQTMTEYITEYITEPIDYTGCNPVIAEHLKRGLKILCLHYPSKERVWVTAFDSGAGDTMRYRVSYYRRLSVLYWVTDVKPITHPKKIKMIMPPERALPILFAAGYSFDGDGDLVQSERGDSLFACNLHYFGKPLDGSPRWFETHPEIIEERGQADALSE